MQLTTNYKLKKPEGTDYAKIASLNENADIIDAELKRISDNIAGGATQQDLEDLETLVGLLSDLQTDVKTSIVAAINSLKATITEHLAESKVSAHKAKNIALEDVDGLFVGTELESAIKELFTNVSNGKQLVGTAITDVDANVTVPTNPTFQELDIAVRSISTGKKFADGLATSSTSTYSFISAGGTNTTSYYIDIMFTDLGFVPSAIYAYLTNKTVASLSAWLNDTFYINGGNSANAVVGNTELKIPYTLFADRVRVAVPTSGGNYTWNARE